MEIIANKTTSTSNAQVPAIEEISPDHLSMKVLAEKLNEVIGVVNRAANRPTRDRGPKSTRDMTREDAWRCRFGDLAKLSHKKAAEELGLSYGQVYSARGGYTMKDVTEDEFAIVTDTPEETKDEGLGLELGMSQPEETETGGDIEEPTDEELAQLMAEDDS